MKEKEYVPLTDKETEQFVKKVGKRMRELRIRKGYTSQETFAFEHSLPRAQYGKYEAGRDLLLTSLLKVVHAYGLTMEEFFSEGFD